MAGLPLGFLQQRAGWRGVFLLTACISAASALATLPLWFTMAQGATITARHGARLPPPRPPPTRRPNLIGSSVRRRDRRGLPADAAGGQRARVRRRWPRRAGLELPAAPRRRQEAAVVGARTCLFFARWGGAGAGGRGVVLLSPPCLSQCPPGSGSCSAAHRHLDISAWHFFVYFFKKEEPISEPISSRNT